MCLAEGRTEPRACRSGQAGCCAPASKVAVRAFRSMWEPMQQTAHRVPLLLEHPLHPLPRLRKRRCTPFPRWSRHCQSPSGETQTPGHIPRGSRVAHCMATARPGCLKARVPSWVWALLTLSLLLPPPPLRLGSTAGQPVRAAACAKEMVSRTHLDDVADDEWQRRSSAPRGRQIGRHAISRALHCREADVELLCECGVPGEEGRGRSIRTLVQLNVRQSSCVRSCRV